jgi:hypothetical protein
MKYRDLIQFDPIESVIVLRSANDQKKAEELVRSYVMSDDMAELVSAKILSQLRLENVVDNKGVLLVGNYGTGKSHLMSVISAVAASSDMLALAQNAKFCTDAKQIAGRFEVLRIEIGSTEMSLRNIITSNIEQDLAQRGVRYRFPDVRTITNNKDALMDMMAVFSEKYGEKGYLIVVDELLDYLRSRKDNELMQDLNFLRELGEIIKSTRFRFISGVQEALFDNSAFRQVSSSLLKMKDRFEQVLIRSEDIAYVAKHRVLRKTAEQKAMIRDHLQPFCKLYQNMADRLEEYVEMFPIHPAYIHTFQHIITVEKREVLKTISETISAILDVDVTAQQPGIISYDTYWKRIKENPSLRTDPAVHEVLSKSTVLEDIVSRTFPKAAYKSIALQIIYALSVHRLTTGTLDAKLGLTAQNLKDELCLYIPMPVMEEDFLLSTLITVLRDIMNTVSGQFIEYNKDNEQYYLDLKKDVDYDKKIQEKADFLGDDRLNSYFFEIIISALEWATPQHVTGYHIYQYQLNWMEKNIFRNGYLFLGNSSDRPTAQPPEDFYVYILPPFGNEKPLTPSQKDEVYFAFQQDGKFKELLRSYAGAKEMEAISAAGETKTTYIQRGKTYLSQLRRWLDEHKTTLFRITYAGTEKPVLEYLKNVRMNELTVKSTVDIAASRALGDYFADKYPEYPRFASPVTFGNLAANRLEALNALVGRPTQLGNSLLESLGLLLDGKIRPENSKYAAYYIQRLKALPDGGVLNFSDIMVKDNGDDYVDRKFKLDIVWISVILTALVYGGYCVLIASDSKRYDAGNMEALCKISPTEIYHFKRLEKPKTMNRQMLNRLFDALDISTGLLASETTYPQALEELQKRAKAYGDQALKMKGFLDKSVTLWGESLIPTNQAEILKRQITSVHKTADDIRSRFTTPAKLKNFDYDDARMDDLEQGIAAMRTAERLSDFKNEMQEIMQYIATAETKLSDDRALRAAFAEKRAAFLALRPLILESDYDTDKTYEFATELNELKAAYVDLYMQQHAAYRLNHAGAQRKGKIQEGTTLKALHALRNIRDILPISQLNETLSQMNAVKVCYECTTPELNLQPDCPHCHFNPADNESRPVAGSLDFIEDRLDSLLIDWTQQLLSALDDPMLEDQRALLGKKQQQILERFASMRRLPSPIDQQFIDSVNAMLSGMESVELSVADLQKAMASWSPCAPAEFKVRLAQWIDNLASGRDRDKVRIVIK